MLSHNYYLKVVPTLYKSSSVTLLSNDYSVNEVPRKVEISPFGQISSLPGVFFIYDITPFMHIVVEGTMSFAHFLIRVCAVIGGVAAVGTRDRLFSRSLVLWTRLCIIGPKCSFLCLLQTSSKGSNYRWRDCFRSPSGVFPSCAASSSWVLRATCPSFSPHTPSV